MTLSTPLFAFPSESSWSNSSRAGQVQTNDRVLARVNDSVITVCDIAKKLESHLQHQTPDRQPTSQMRFEFYSRYWPQVLRDCIDRELILADAKDRGVVATHGQVREEMEVLFGPGIVETLEKLHLSYSEAFESVKNEITIRRMLLYRTHYPAQHQVGPKLVRSTYRDFVEAHKGGNKWIFRVISVQDPDSDRALETAKRVQEIIARCGDWPTAQVDVERLAGKSGAIASVRISEIYSQKEGDLSDNYRRALNELRPKSCSSPIFVDSKKGRALYRLFYLIEREDRPCPTLRESAAKLREVLIEERAGEITQKYLDTLRVRYGVQLEQIQERIPLDFSPFSLS